MKKVVKYSLVSDYKENFNTVANRLIDKGYQPFGSVSIAQYGRGTIIAQSFVKYEDKEDKEDKEENE